MNYEEMKAKLFAANPELKRLYDEDQELMVLYEQKWTEQVRQETAMSEKKQKAHIKIVGVVVNNVPTRWVVEGGDYAGITIDAVNSENNGLGGWTIDELTEISDIAARVRQETVQEVLEEIAANINRQTKQYIKGAEVDIHKSNGVILRGLDRIRQKYQLREKE